MYISIHLMYLVGPVEKGYLTSDLQVVVCTHTNSFLLCWNDPSIIGTAVHMICSECKIFQPGRPSSVAMYKVCEAWSYLYTYT